MKLVIVLVGLSVAVMVVLIVQAASQELKLQNLRTRIVENKAEVTRKERAVVELKINIEEMTKNLASVNIKIQELKLKKDTREQSSQALIKGLETCETAMGDVEKKKTAVREAITKLKADNEEAKKKAEEDIQQLKQQILQRDKTICEFADTTNEGARKLCGIVETAK